MAYIKENGAWEVTQLLGFLLNPGSLVPEPMFLKCCDILPHAREFCKVIHILERSRFKHQHPGYDKTQMCVEILEKKKSLIASWCHPWLDGPNVLFVPLLPWRQSQNVHCFLDHSVSYSGAGTLHEPSQLCTYPRGKERRKVGAVCWKGRSWSWQMALPSRDWDRQSCHDQNPFPLRAQCLATHGCCWSSLGMILGEKSA